MTNTDNEKPNERLAGTLTVDKGVDLPTKIDALLRRGPRRKYPFPSMAVGDSFVIPDPIVDKDAFTKARMSVNVFNSTERKKETMKALIDGGYTAKEMVVGQDDKDGVWRCWRVK